VNTDLFWVGFPGLPTLSAKHSASKKLGMETPLCSQAVSSPLLPGFTFSSVLFLIAASIALWQLHRCPSSLGDELGGSCRRSGTDLGGVKSAQPALPEVRGCSPALCAACPRGS